MLSLETIANDADNLISTIGYQEAAPRQDYPVRVIPKRYSFDMDAGRRLGSVSSSVPGAGPSDSLDMQI